jgi:DNA-binding response OmpR family regulator
MRHGSMKILLIEDDDAIIALLTRSLNTQNHIVDTVKDGESGWTYASTFDYGAIVLDIMLPKLDGISLCKKLRGAGYTTPILLLTSQNNTTAKVQGLEAGADDYMVKPFDVAELNARICALLRRGSINPLPLLSWGDLLLNPSSCEVSYDGKPLTLTTKEYDLLELFLRDSYRVFSNDEIIDRLWSSDDFPAEATVRSHLRRLRQKLQAAGAPANSITTIHGRGYYLKLPEHKPIEAENKAQIQPPDRNTSIAPELGAKSPPCEDKSDSQADLQQQYLAFLQQTWIESKTQCQDRLTEISQIVDRLLTGDANYLEQQQAHHQAHKLVGTLGVFNLISAMEIARQIDIIVDRSTLLTPIAAATLPDLLDRLRCDIASNAPTPTAATDVTISTVADRSNLPLILLIDLHPNLSKSIADIAEDRGYQTVILATLQTAENYLATTTNVSSSTTILVGLEIDRQSDLFEWIHNIDRQFPPQADRSILVLSEYNDLNHRLAVVRHGGKFLCITGLTADRIFTVATASIQSIADNIKVMVVDDDLDWLRALPKLLAPWGLKLTTLANPQQFWTILQSVQPDVLLLDLKMPEINGFELCQVLRSDPSWQHLPILFLTATQDRLSQQEAFRVGADDYLCKPISGGELAQRIHHRLARFQVTPQ